MSASTYKANNLKLTPALEQGSALLMSLIFLVILTVLGLAALNSSTNETQISTNIQQAKTAFYTAQSGSNAYVNEGNTGNDLDPGVAGQNHILTLTRNAADPGDLDSTDLADALTRCAQADGTNGVTCAGNFYLQENFKARTDTWYRGCNGPATECPGFSLGVGTTIPGCHLYQVQGTGWIDLDGADAAPSNSEETQAIVDQWLTEVALCPPT